MLRLFALVSLLCCFAALAGWGQSAGASLAQGDKLVQSKDYGGALQAYLAAWMAAPDNPTPVVRIGDLFVTTGKPIDATRFYAAATKLNPGYEDAVAGLAYAYVQANHPEQSVALLEEPTRKRAFAQAWRVQHALGLAYIRLSRLSEAQAAIRTAIGIMPDVAYLRGDLGNALYLAKDYAGALAAYDEALRLDGADAQATLNRSCALEQLGRYTDAIAAVERYLELSNAGPDDPQRRRLAALQARAGTA